MRETPLFQPVAEPNFPALEEEVLRFWKAERIFEEVSERQGPEFVFYEGPPTANGHPAMHHVLARAFKDLFPRFKTMQGYHVTRKGGWDTHGLPVEIAVEKELGVLGRQSLSREEIIEFNQTCRKWVFANIEDWRRFSERMGYWVDLERAYVTYENSYIESVWNLLKRLWERGLIVRDYKVVPVAPKIATTLSANEIADGYQEVDDPSVYVRFPLEAPPPELAEALRELPELALLIWTTTPWTLPSNVLAAVHPELTYAAVRSSMGGLIVAEGALPRLRALKEEPLEVVARFPGAALEGWRYRPPFPEVLDELGLGHLREPKDGRPQIHFVALGRFVSEEDGTGVAHLAPAYGADDLEVGRAYGVPLIFGTNQKGIMEVGAERGKFFKEADRGIIRALRERGLLYHAGTYRHSYPFYDRTGDPILYFAKPSWFIKTSLFREALYAKNLEIRWVPEHIKLGRFGNWLRENVDWAISRERYWGTPLPFWMSETGEVRCVGSLAELEALSGRDLKGLDLHRPYIDEVTFSLNGQEFRRVPEVLDVWFDSGAMPYAQWGLLMEGDRPVRGYEEFRRHFPADFISEGIDQTRGWFYSLHVLATLLYDQPAFRNVVCLGHLVDERGQKMSKSKGNVVEPMPIFDRYGADAVRWYMYTASDPGEAKRFSERLVAEGRSYLQTLWNTYSFFVLYANLDHPQLKEPNLDELSAMDRWLLSRLSETVEQATEFLENYRAREAAQSLEAFLEELSNWYVRRNRRRFWKNDDEQDREAAYATLYTALLTLTQLSAPFTPFLAEGIWHNLSRARPEAPRSVHLATWPQPGPRDEELLKAMRGVLKVVSLGRKLRAQSGIKTRIPLPLLLVSAPQEAHPGLERFLDEIAEELNVKEVRLLPFGEALLRYRVRPNLPLLGPKYGPRLPLIRQALSALPGSEVAPRVQRGEPLTLTIEGEAIELLPQEILVEAEALEGYPTLEDEGFVVALQLEVSEELFLEGLARELIRLIQQARKEAGLEVHERIRLRYRASGRYREALSRHLERLAEETLAREVKESAEPLPLLRDDEEGRFEAALERL